MRKLFNPLESVTSRIYISVLCEVESSKCSWFDGLPRWHQYGVA